MGPRWTLFSERMPGGSSDPLTAGADSIARRDSAVLTLEDCWRAFIRRPSPPLLGVAILAALGVRIALGSYDWRDLVVAAGIVVLTPPVEWAIHVYLLHARPLRVFGRPYDLLAAREHRAHHMAPAELDGVLIPAYAVGIFVAQIALTVWLVSFPAHLVLGGERLAQNEHYWFGVTSTVGDHLLRTTPEQSDVPKSPTARTLGVEVH
jgi:hypothetical protein